MSLLDKIVHFINEKILKNTPEEQLKKALKAIKKQINKTKPSMVEIRTNFLTPEFAEYMFNIYRILIPFIGFFKIDFAQKEGAPFRAYLANSIMSSKHEDILIDLSEEEMVKKVASMDKDKLFKYFEDKVKQFYACFDQQDSMQINTTYNSVAILGALGKFDFFAFFREFDTSFKDKIVNYRPVFHARDGKYFVEDIVALDKVFSSVNFNNKLIDALKIYLDFKQKPIPIEGELKDVFKAINNLKKHDILLNLIKVLKADLTYVTPVIINEDNLVSDYVKRRIEEWEACINKLLRVISDKKINNITEKLFEKSRIPPIHNYCEKKNELLKQYDLKQYNYFNELFVTKGFIIEKYEKYMKELVNNIILKGNYTEKSTQKMLSDNFYELNEVLKIILEFDNSMGEEGEHGKKIKTLLLTVNKEKTAKNLANEIVSNGNNFARDLITGVIKNLKAIMSFSKTLLETYSAGRRDLLQNIKTFDLGNTANVIKDFKRMQTDVILYLNIIKEYSKH
ncbi:DUF5312 family protein [Spirochaetota bacterium]